MKNLFTITCIIFFFIISNTAKADWVRGNGIYYYGIWAISFDGNTLFGGTSNGIYLSSNNGANWTQSNLTSGYIRAIINSGSYIFTGAYLNGVLFSSNNGINWQHTSIYQSTYALTISDNYIFAGTVYTVWSSTNNGINWNQTSINHSINALASNGNKILAANNGGIDISTNYGINWSSMGLNEYVLSLLINGNTTYAGTRFYGIYLTTNDGINWIHTASNLTYIASLASFGNIIFAGAETGFYLSTDNGNSWIQKNEGFLSGLEVLSICIANNYIIIGSNQGAWYRPLSEVVGVINISNEVPLSYNLYQNYPNPFNPSTNIKFDVSYSPFEGGKGDVKLIVYDILGKEIAVLVNEQLSPGTYDVAWNAAGCASGIYYYRLTEGNYSETKKMLLVK